MIGAKVTHAEDIEEVRKFAKFRKMTIGEALENKTMKTILSDAQEERTTAEATHTGSTRKGSSKVSDATMIAQADNDGIYPDDPMELIMARERQKQGQNKN